VAPASFDPLPETIVNITFSIKKIPKQWIHRQLDDVPMVSPQGSGFTEAFTKGYAKICRDLGVPLAEKCPNHEKAFGTSTYGIVLGIGFDLVKLEWYITKEKANDLQKCIDEILARKTCALLDAQTLHGKLSSFAQMSDFMMGFRFQLVSFLRKFGEDEKGNRLTPKELKDNLWIWKKMIDAARRGIPLGKLCEDPPLFPLKFISDAAGAVSEAVAKTSQTLETGGWPQSGSKGKKSVGSESSAGRRSC
jgi:hypothetical protein